MYIIIPFCSSKCSCNITVWIFCF